MTLVELIEEFRSQVQDEAKPYLFRDVEIMRWLVDAQDMFVRDTGGIADSRTVALIDVPVTVNEPWSSFSPYILRIRSGRLVTAEKNIEFIHEADLELRRMRDYGFPLTGTFLSDTDTGDVAYGILGMTDNQIRWYKVPAESDTCRLHIYRLPYPRIVDENDALEIAEQHHIHLIKWMKHMAYSKEDAETYDKSLAEQNESAFNTYVEKASRELERQRHKPKQVRYGGIPF